MQAPPLAVSFNQRVRVPLLGERPLLSQASPCPRVSLMGPLLLLAAAAAAAARTAPVFVAVLLL